MTLPVVELARGCGPALVDALVEHGAVLVRDAAVPIDRFRRALDDAAAFFALPDAELAHLAIEGSPHFRGYSVMHNERDWREQAHFGREAPAVDSPDPHWRLQGPNRWPASDAWSERTAEWIETTERVGRDALAEIADALGVESAPWLGSLPYLVVKLIAYHPQADSGHPRPGVAAHVDFSLVTLTMQDEVGGLQVRDAGGEWLDVRPVPGTWLLHAGELLAYVTGGRIPATPHRVVNPSTERTRYSMPLFLCPALDANVVPSLPPVDVGQVRPDEHVHEVLDPANPPSSIDFGPAEWHRKGEDVWCRICCTEDG